VKRCYLAALVARQRVLEHVRWHRPWRLVVLLLLLAAPTTPAASAQSLLDRPPNLSGDWVGVSGTLYFNFLHRFSTSPAPERKVANVPTFAIAAGLPARTLVGAHYATNSQLAPRYPNEWEFFVRHSPFSQAAGAPLDMAAQVGYNLASEGVDGEVSVARREGPVRVMLVGRILADPFVAGQTRFAGGAGATLRLGRYVALAGDAASIFNPLDDERLAWSAGLHLALPHTPHTLSLHAANTNAATLQGASRGEDEVRYGFEFTVPLTLRRWFGGTAPAPAPASHAAPAAAVRGGAGEVVGAGIRGFAFTPGRLEVAVGTTIEWKNDDPVAHTVTADDGSFDSGSIESGAIWRHSFDTPGTYTFTCAPHPFMKGSVVVR
jgi:plastocyanin